MNIRLLECYKAMLFVCLFMAAPSIYAQPAIYEIYAIEFATLPNKIPVAGTAIGSASRDSTGVSYMVWLLRGNGKNILVDAGFTDTTISPGIIFTRPDRTLTKLNLSSGDITDIILTHPHWDHIGGLDLFPRANVWMQKNDYDYFTGEAWQEKGNASGFNKKDVLAIVQRNLDKKLILVNGDGLEIMPGIKVYIGSKHTYESQFVLVEGVNEKVIIASDNCWFYHNARDLQAIPATLDEKAYISNLKRMKTMVSNPDLIIPGHDPLVFKKIQIVTDRIVRISK